MTAGTTFVENRVDETIIHRVSPDMARIYVEPTSRCPQQCVMCVRTAWSDEQGDMTDETFGALLDQLASLPQLRQVVIGGFGEPLLHPRIFDWIGILKHRGLRVTVSTNGLLLESPACRSLVEAGLDSLVVSVDGFAPEIYAAVRRGSELDRVSANLRSLAEAKRRLGRPVPRVGLEFVLLKTNAAQLPLLPAFARTVGAGFALVTNVLPHTPAMAEQAVYAHGAELPRLAGWAVATGDWLEWGLVELPRMSAGTYRRCRFVEGKSAVIGWDGAVSPCYALMHSYPYYTAGRRKNVTRYDLGNITRRPLCEIWMSEGYARFRATVRRFDFPPCGDCGLSRSCDYAAQNQGCWGWNPSCADCLWAQDIIRCP